MSKRKSKKYRQIREVRVHSSQEEWRALKQENEELLRQNQSWLILLAVMHQELNRVYIGVQEK